MQSPLATNLDPLDLISFHAIKEAIQRVAELEAINLDMVDYLDESEHERETRV